MQRKFKVKGIFLDLDGTLVDSTPAYIEAAKMAFRAVGKTPPPTEVLLELWLQLQMKIWKLLDNF